MAVQSEAALENALIHALEQMSYEYVKIEEESNLRDNFKCQLEKHNRKQLAEIGREHFTESEFEKILLHLEGCSRFEKSKKLRDLGLNQTSVYLGDCATSIHSKPKMGNVCGWNFSIRNNGVRMSFRYQTKSPLRAGRNAAMI